MPDPQSLLQAQHNDYQTLLSATEALLNVPLGESDVATFLALREQCRTATQHREPLLMAALQQPLDPSMGKAVAAYRAVLEALVAAEGHLLTMAEASRDALGSEVRALGEGYRALSGYRTLQRSGDARAISQRI